jgi:hypothetical protein
MSLAESTAFKPNGQAGLWPSAPGRTAGKAAEKVQTFVRSPSLAIRRAGKPSMQLHTDRVRAKPAVTPQLSMMIGFTAIGLGVWGSLFPRSVQKMLGVQASPSMIRAAFGAREMWSGYSLAGDPTQSSVLWARVAGDVFDISVLGALDRPGNPKRQNAKLALGFVLAVTALDVLTAIRLSNVQRNCA